MARMEQPKGVDWTVVILTCQYKDSVEVFQRGREPSPYIPLQPQEPGRPGLKPGVCFFPAM